MSSFSVRGVSAAVLLDTKVTTLRALPSTGPRRSKLVVQARYGYSNDEDDTSSRRPNRQRSEWDDDAYSSRTPPARQSWDEDFDAPSRMDRASRDGGTGGGRGYSREGGGRGGYGGGRGRGGYSRGPPAYEQGYQGEGQGTDDRAGGGYGRGRGRGGGGGGRGYGFSGDQQGERRPYGARREMSGDQFQQRNELNQAIRDARSWRDLSDFIAEKGSLMDAENVSNILFKLTGRAVGQYQGGGDFSRPREEGAAAEYDRLLSTLLGWVLVTQPNYRPRQVQNTLQSLAKLELWNVEVVNALVATCVKQMGNVEPQGYASIMWAFTKFNYSPGQEFFDSLVNFSAKRLQDMDGGDVAKLAQCMSKLGCAPTATWAEAFWKASSGKLAALTELQVGDILMATAYFAQAGQQPPQQWVDKVFGSFVETEPERAQRAAAQQAEYQKQLDQLARQQATAAEDAKPEALPPKPVLKERPLPRIQLINKMLYTLSNLSNKPSPAWFAAVVDAWRRQLQYCSSSDLGNIALYLGRYLSVPVSSAMCAQLVKEVTKGTNSGKFKGDDLAAVAYLLSASRYKGSEKEIDDLVYVLKQRLPECSLASLELVYNALPALGSGYRLNETVTEAANRYNDLAAQQAAAQPQDEVQAEAAVATA